MLNGFVYKLRGIHGIRWVASMRDILAKVYKMLHIIVMDLDMRAKEKFGASAASHTMHTADEMFVGVQFKLGGETRKYKVSETVPSDDAGSTTCFTATTLRGDKTRQDNRDLEGRSPRCSWQGRRHRAARGVHQVRSRHVLSSFNFVATNARASICGS